MSAARLCIPSAWMCPQQRAFKSILRIYSSSPFILSSELFKNANKQLLPGVQVHIQHHSLCQDTKYTAHSSISYSTDSRSTSNTEEDEKQRNSSSKTSGVGVGGEAGDGTREKLPRHRDAEREPLPEWPDGVNPHTGEKGGPKGPEPTRYGDWERKGRVSDF